MQQIIDFHTFTLDKIEGFKKNLSVNGKNIDGENPLKFLAMANNTLVQSYEIVSYYKSIWDRDTSCTIITKSRGDRSSMTPSEENAQRIINVSKSTFIQIMSSLEFCLKEIIKNKFQTTKNIKYMRDAVDLIHDKGIICLQVKNLWGNIITIRNKATHNNCIAQENLTFSFNVTLPGISFSPTGNVVTVNLVKNQMIQGDMMFFYNLISLLVENYYQIVKKIYP